MPGLCENLGCTQKAQVALTGWALRPSQLTRGMSHRRSSCRKPSPHCQSRTQELWEPGGQGDNEGPHQPPGGSPPTVQGAHLWLPGLC